MFIIKEATYDDVLKDLILLYNKCSDEDKRLYWAGDYLDTEKFYPAEKFFKQERKRFFVGYDCNQPIVILGKKAIMDKDDKYVTNISLSIMTPYKRRGNGYKSLRIFISMLNFFEDCSDMFIYEVKSDNIASIKLAEKLGFTFDHDDADIENGKIYTIKKNPKKRKLSL